MGDVVGDKTPGGPSPTPSVDRWGRSARNEFVNTFVFVLCALTASAGVKLNYDDGLDLARIVIIVSGASLGAMVLAIAGLFYTRDPETYSATLNDNSDYDYSSSYFYD